MMYRFVKNRVIHTHTHTHKTILFRSQCDSNFDNIIIVRWIYNNNNNNNNGQ